jgi:multiple sugar transport system substrate-binding protein
MRVRTILLAAALILAPLSARAADLVVWWEKSFDAGGDAALEELVSDFERAAQKEVELVLLPLNEVPARVLAALEAGRPPDLAYGLLLSRYLGEWAHQGRLMDLSDAVGSLANLIDPDALELGMLLDGTTTRRALFAIPVGRTGNHLHVWRDLLERAGFTLADIPGEWGPFWSFWCDRVQPALRQATGRNDVWGLGLAMSTEASGDTAGQLFQFQLAHGAEWLTRAGELVVDDPTARGKLVTALDEYTAVFRKGCIPPDAVAWNDGGNNQAFLARRVVLTANETLSIMNALKITRPDDYYRYAVSLAWPALGRDGRPLLLLGDISQAAAFEEGGHAGLALEFVRFLFAQGGLVRYLDEANERVLPPMRSLLERPFWLDPRDPHRMHSAMQAMSRSHATSPWYIHRGNFVGYRKVAQENVWPKAVHRVAAEGITPEQAVDEAIARIKQLLSE